MSPSYVLDIEVLERDTNKTQSLSLKSANLGKEIYQVHNIINKP